MQPAIHDEDPYQLLGVTADASGEQIRRAYRRLAMTWHPDRNRASHAEDTFKRIRQAYDLLRDPHRRADFDRRARRASSSAGHAPRRGRAAPDAGPGPSAAPQAARGSAGRGRDLVRTLSLSLEEQVAGCRARLKIVRRTFCEPCAGSGRLGSQPAVCGRCLGSGRIRQPRLGFFTFRLETLQCPECGGSGTSHPRCAVCGGTGGGPSRAGYLSFDVPAGARPGSTLRVRGHGRMGRAGQAPGDLLVKVGIARHLLFRPDFPHLECELPVDLLAVLAGDDIEVPTLDGMARIALPAGAPDGTILRIAGEGMLDGASGRRGDLLFRLRVVPPDGLTPAQAALLEEIRRVLSAGPTPPRAVREWRQRVERAVRRRKRANRS